ncbi:MAG TPA: CBS domain-containing protein, partial [Candidatus Obscuribacterales bacterium]
GAGSAVVKVKDPQNVIERVEELLRSSIRPEKTARQIMTSPVRTVRPTVSMDEASRIMIRHGQDGLVVTEDHNVVGIVSRRDIDQATHHKLGHAPVQGFMSKPVITIGPDATLSEIQHLMVTEDIGRLPVLDEENRLVGLVSRQNVLRTLYGSADGADFLMGGGEGEKWGTARSGAQINLREKLDSLNPSTVWLCQLLGTMAGEINMSAYAVGGFVRDLLLGIANFDLDFVIEGSAIELAEALHRAFPSRLRVKKRHERFQTAALEFYAETVREVDLSTARTEFYEYPAALPTVEPSELEHDLVRRDFTINALAVCLNPGQYGKLIDFFGGLADIKSRLIRILHPFSFIEDPTRIIRAARFASRLGFELEPKTKEQARRAIAMGIFDDLGGTRIRDELRLILESSHRIKALDLLADIGGRLRYLDAELEYGLPVRSMIRRAERLLEHYSVGEPWIVHLGLLLSRLSEERLPNVLNRLLLPNEQKDYITHGLDIPKRLKEIGGELKRSEIYSLFHGRARESLAIAACLAPPGSPLRRMLKLYLEELADVQVELSGNDLKALGFSEGPAIGEALELLRKARLDGSAKSRADELKLIEDCYGIKNGANARPSGKKAKTNDQASGG